MRQDMLILLRGLDWHAALAAAGVVGGTCFTPPACRVGRVGVTLRQRRSKKSRRSRNKLAGSKINSTRSTNASKRLDKSDSTEVRRAAPRKRVAPSRNEVKSCSTDCYVVDVARPAAGVARAKAADAGRAAAPSPAPAPAATVSAPSAGTRYRTKWVNVVSI